MADEKEKDLVKEILSEEDVEGLSEKDKQLLKYYSDNFVSLDAKGTKTKKIEKPNIENNAKEIEPPIKQQVEENISQLDKSKQSSKLDEVIGGFDKEKDNNLEQKQEKKEEFKYREIIHDDVNQSESNNQSNQEQNITSENEEEPEKRSFLDKAVDLLDAFIAKIKGLFKKKKKEEPVEQKENIEEQVESTKEQRANEVEENQEEKEEKPKKKLFGSKKSKTSSSTNGEYKPPFVKSYKFWVLIVLLICSVGFVTYIIVNSIRNAEPKLPAGFVFETQVNGVYTPKNDLLVHTPELGSDSFDVRVSFSKPYSGNIELSLTNNGIAYLNKEIVSNNEIVKITPTRYANTGEVIGGKTYLVARYQTVFARLEILIDKRLTSLEITDHLDPEDEQAFINENKTQRCYVDRMVYLTAQANFGYTAALPEDDFGRKIRWTSSNPNVATIDENGVITSYRAGTATFAASAQRYYGDNFTQLNTKTIEFFDVPINTIAIKNREENSKQTLWLSNNNDIKYLEINLNELVEIHPNTGLVPSNFNADYMFKNARFEYYGNNVKINVERVGDGIFRFSDVDTLHETRNSVESVKFNVWFGRDETQDITLLRYGAQNYFDITIKRDKDYMLTLAETEKNTAEIANIYFDVDNTHKYSTGAGYDLLSLFPLDISKRETGTSNNDDKSATGNNFDKVRDIVFEGVDEYVNDLYTIEKKDNKWYFIPSASVLSAAVNNGEGFRIRAYLKDINYDDSAISLSDIGVETAVNSKLLFIKVVKPSESDLDVYSTTESTYIQIKNGEDASQAIFNTLRSGRQSDSISINISGSGSTSLKKDSVFNFDSNNVTTPAPSKLHFVVTTQPGENNVYVRKDTPATICLSENGHSGWVYTFNVTIYYTYNFTPIGQALTNTNTVALKTISVRLKVVN